jgi:hypothetical protein
MKKWVDYITLWLPFLYAMAISVVALHGMSLSPISLPPGLIPFLAFIPMAFFFSALYVQRQVSRLEKRIEDLEKRARSGRDSISN